MHSYIGHAYQTSSEDAASAVYAIGLGINLSFHTLGLRACLFNVDRSLVIKKGRLWRLGYSPGTHQVRLHLDLYPFQTII